MAKIAPWTTEAEHEACVEYWNKVREGIVKSAPHDFSAADGDVSHLVEMYRARATESLHAAARFAAMADQLATA